MEALEFINQLKNSCLVISKDWQEHLEFWEDEEPGYYNDIAIMVHYVINQYKKSQTGDFCNIFEIVEKAITSGNPDTEELALIGFLEGILFVGSHSDIRPSHFKPWLGKMSLAGMIELEQFFTQFAADSKNHKTKKNWLARLKNFITKTK